MSPVETLRLRPASLDDATVLYRWRNDPETRARSHNQAEIMPEEHRLWLEQSLAMIDRLILIGEATRTDMPVGVVRFDRQADDGWRIGITVDPALRGRGWAAKLLAAGLERLGPQRFDAQVMADNDRSLSLFERAGFQRLETVGGIVRLGLDRREAA